jgi:hypothetical protein
LQYSLLLFSHLLHPDSVPHHPDSVLLHQDSDLLLPQDIALLCKEIKINMLLA